MRGTKDAPAASEEVTPAGATHHPRSSSGSAHAVNADCAANVGATADNRQSTFAADLVLVANFVEQFGPSQLLSIPAEGGNPCVCTDNDVDAAARWAVEENDAGHNVYFAVNPLRRRLKKKATKADIAHASWVFVDLDPRAGEPLEAERERLRCVVDELNPQPSLVIDSGGGLWAFWRLQEPADPDAAEACGRALAQQLGGDACFNVDRIARLPGTANWPDAKKRQKGREPALAAVVSWNDAAYTLDSFPTAAVDDCAAGVTGQHTVNVPDEVCRLDGVDALDEWAVPDRTKVIIVQGHHPDEGPKEGDNSRSAWLFDAVCSLVRCGVPDEVVYAVITDPDFGISESVRDKGTRAKRYARKQIATAKETVAEDAADFEYNDNGNIKAGSQHNVRLALRKLGAQLSHDVFTDERLCRRDADRTEPLDDAVLDRLWLEIDERFNFRPTKDFFDRVVRDAARRNAFHPVCDYLDSLRWDGTPRLDTWLVDFAGAEDSDYVRAVGTLLLIAAVRRVRRPGVKFDELVVFESPQGTNKSSALAALCPDENWFSDDLPLNSDAQRVIERTKGKWLVEAGELSGMRRGDIEHLKSFLSRQKETARLAYGRTPTTRPRHFVVVGTTNDDKYLRDTTGNRRFWPVRVAGFYLPALRRNRDQLWAEAAQREADGASIRLDASLWQEAAVVQEQRRELDPFEEQLAKVLGDLNGKLLTDDAWAIVGKEDVGRRTQDDMSRLGQSMRRLGFERTKLRSAGGVRWHYARGDVEQRARRIVVRTEPSTGEVWAGYQEDMPREVPY